MATGGALKPQKCWWSLIDFKHTPQGWQYITSHDTPGLKIEVLTEKGIRTPIQRLDCTEGIRSLGVHFVLNRRCTAEFNYLLDQIEEWGRGIKLAPLSRRAAWATLLQCASKSLEYPLAAVTSDDQQCNKLYKALQQAFIQKVGVSSKFPTVP